MKQDLKNTCREIIYLFITLYSDFVQPFLGTFTLFIFLPAFFYGCGVPQTSPDPIGKSSVKIGLTKVRHNIGHLDILTFRNDRLQKLDCYQKVDDYSCWDKEVTSGSGDRIIAVCANSNKDLEDWSYVSSMSYMKEITVSLEEESLSHPFMSGLSEVDAGQEGRYTEIMMSPIYSSVELRSISCDFSDRPYAGESITDVRVYLTNVNAECRILDTEDIRPARIINAGMLREDDLAQFENPEIIVRYLDGEIDQDTVYPDIRLICYPNNSISEGPGTPFTRLVIEGKIAGETFYWPVNINRDEEGYGIGRNERYIYDLKITRKGTKDPDVPVKVGEMTINFDIEKWEERKDYPILF